MVGVDSFTLIALFVGLMMTSQVTCSGLDNSSCPDEWVLSPSSGSCLWFSHNTRNYGNDMIKTCQRLGANSISITSEEEWESFKGLAIVEKMLEGHGIWIPLFQLRNGSYYYWNAGTGYHEATSLPEDLKENVEPIPEIQLCRGSGLKYTESGLRMAFCSFQENLHFVCEIPAKCQPGWFGEQCEKECHCHGQSCGPVNASGEVTCPYGCDLGWTGNACSEPKSEANVNYFCINSSGKNGVIAWIDTKGTKYLPIHPVDKTGGSFVNWCGHWNTSVDDTTGAITMDLEFDADLFSSLSNCAGENIENDKYRFHFKLEESGQIVSRTDKLFSIECDFKNSNQLSVAREAKLKNEMWFSDSSIQRPVEKVKEKKERIDLLLVDPSTGQPIPWARLGVSVALQIRFGWRNDSVLSGVRPYNCAAVSLNGDTELKFIDANGCPEENSPISGFTQRSPTSLTTQPFPMFGLGWEKRFNFQCEYEMCFGGSHCPESDICDQQQQYQDDEENELEEEEELEEV